MEHLESLGQVDFKSVRIASQIDIKNSTAMVTVKMAMLLHIWAVTGRFAFQIDLADQTALHQRIQTVVNGRHRNIVHLLFRAQENFFGGGMIPLLEQNIVNMLPLGGETQAAGGQPFVQVMLQFSLASAFHLRAL